MFKGQRKAREAVGTVSKGKKKKKKEVIPLNPAPFVADLLLKKANPGVHAFLDFSQPSTADGIADQDFQLGLALFYAIYPELLLEFPQMSFIPSSSLYTEHH